MRIECIWNKKKKMKREQQQKPQLRHQQYNADSIFE